MSRGVYKKRVFVGERGKHKDSLAHTHQQRAKSLRQHTLWVYEISVISKTSRQRKVSMRCSFHFCQVTVTGLEREWSRSCQRAMKWCSAVPKQLLFHKSERTYTQKTACPGIQRRYWDLGCMITDEMVEGRSRVCFFQAEVGNLKSCGAGVHGARNR